MVGTFSVSSEKGSASGTLLCEQSKWSRVSMDRPPVEAVPEEVTSRPTPQSAPCKKAVLECVRNRAPPPPAVAIEADVAWSQFSKLLEEK